ncbi:MAG: hypothetical protein ACOC1K_03405 [Nanoarchaeota archaeon]
MKKSLFSVSYRHLKFWLNIPLLVFDKLFSKLVNYIPFINFTYKIRAGKIDSNLSLSPSTLNHDPVKMDLAEIKNKKLRKSLKLSGIFNNWNVYYIRNRGEMKSNISDNNRDVIYLSKDELKKGDTYYGERLSDTLLNNNYSSNKKRKFLKKNGLSTDEFYKLEPQMFVIAAVHSNEHDEMKKEREVRYERNNKKSLEKAVKKAIKYDNLFTTGSVKGDWSRYPIFHKVVSVDRIDLAQKLLDAAFDDDERKELVSYSENPFGDNMYTKKPIELAKSDEMKSLINKWL